MNNFKEFIPTYNDFPKKGIIFRDTLKILQYPKIFNDLILKMSDNKITKNAEAIIAIDARGFIFGSAIASLIAKPIIVARKEGKLPGELITEEYSLEYGKDNLSIQKNAIECFKSFVIVDDVIATGGTAESVYNLLTKMNKTVTGVNVFVEIDGKFNKCKLKVPTYSIVKFD